MDAPMRIALLFDGDNANTKYIPRIIKMVSGFGEIIINKVYADWEKVTAEKWIHPSLIHHIRPEQVFNYKPGKNASDFTLLGDALEMAFKKEVDCICIVSSDSDFTDIILRLHRYKVKSIVIGTPAASLALVTVCDIFIDERTLPEDEKLSVRFNNPEEEIAVSPEKILKRKRPRQKQPFKVVGKTDISKFLKKKKRYVLAPEIILQAYQASVDPKSGMAPVKKFHKEIIKIKRVFHLEQHGFNSLKGFLLSLNPAYEVVEDGMKKLHVRKT
jgi:uncharacterized protein (TIGR00288 family)